MWVSARSLNVYASFALCLPLTTNHIPNITQILALSAIDCLQQCGVQDVLLKWPNDLVIRDSKLGGILAQSTTGGGIAAGCIAVVVGIGININATTDDLSAIQRPIWPPTSVYIATGKTLDLQQVRQALIASFANNLREFLSSGYSVFVPRISKLLALRGQSVRMNDGETEWEGVQQGITPEGFLQLQLADGTIKTFVSAEHVHNVRPA